MLLLLNLNDVGGRLDDLEADVRLLTVGWGVTEDGLDGGADDVSGGQVRNVTTAHLDDQVDGVNLHLEQVDQGH